MTRKAKKQLLYSSIAERRTENLLRAQKPMIGIDIGTSLVKIVQIKNNRIIRSGIGVLPEGMISQGRILEITQLSGLIKKIMKANKIAGDTCSVCISGNEVIVRELKLPEMNGDQILDNIKHEITSFLPMKQEEYCIDYKILEYLEAQEGASGKLRIMVAAAPGSLVQSYIDALKLAKLKTAYVDVIPNIAGKLAKQITHGNAGNIGIIDFGANSTNFTVTKNGNYILHKSITNGGDYLTSQIAKKYSIDMLEAEALKKKSNFFENNYQNGENQFVETYMNHLVMDIERTIEFFKGKNNQISLDVIYVTGGGSLLKGLTGYLKNHFNMEITSLSDALQQYRKKNENAETMAFCSQAIGATLREE